MLISTKPEFGDALGSDDNVVPTERACSCLQLVSYDEDTHGTKEESHSFPKTQNAH